MEGEGTRTIWAVDGSVESTFGWLEMNYLYFVERLNRNLDGILGICCIT